jgi:hypothetical protein
MDTTLTVGGGTTLGAAETATPEPSTGTESAASETKETDASGEQSTAEGGQEQTAQGRKRWSIQDEVKELRAQRRELREQLRSSEETREELRQLREDLNRRTAQPGTAKTPANFWQDPEARLQSLRDEIRDEIGEQNRGLMDAFHQTREQEYAEQALNQERAQATEFIRSQKGFDPADEEDIVEIIKDLPPNVQRAWSPMIVAEYAWYKFQATRGVGDRSLAKQRASGVQGQPPGTGFGRKIWTKAEYDATLDQIEKTPTNPKWNELIAELESAHKEGRVR